MSNNSTLFEKFVEKYPNFAGDCRVARPHQSEFLVEYFSGARDLVYVDVGSNNGVSWSNTLFLKENYGWSGICIEPNKILYEESLKIRNDKHYNCAIDEFSRGNQEFYQISGPCHGIGTLSSKMDSERMNLLNSEIQKFGGSYEKIQVPVRRLGDILFENKITRIDYLSIDVEGNELSVLKGIDWINTNIELISTEANNTIEVDKYLYPLGYVRFAKINADDFYKKIKK